MSKILLNAIDPTCDYLNITGYGLVYTRSTRRCPCGDGHKIDSPAAPS